MISGSGWVAVYQGAEGDEGFTLPVVCFDEDVNGWVCFKGVVMKADSFCNMGFAGYRHVADTLAIPVALHPGLRVELDPAGSIGTVLAILVEDRCARVVCDRQVGVVALVEGKAKVLCSGEIRGWRLSGSASRRRQPSKRRSSEVGDSV